jgi:hypothetical protein
MTLMLSSCARDLRLGVARWQASHDFRQRLAKVDGTATQRASGAAGAAERAG